jgi:uncharacterized UPF0160 family protein
MTMEKKVKKLVTHSGSFHTDDIFATVVLSLVLEKQNQEFEIIRTRDPEIIKSADYVYDVGGIYDEASNRFDHHQVGGAGKNEYNIEYSSFGLVWKKFGEELCGSKRAADIINKKLVSPVDAHDNGMDLVTNKYNVSPYQIQYFFFSMVPTWKEENLNTDEMFLESVKIARTILLREIAQAGDQIIATDAMETIYNNTQVKQILIFDKNYPSAEVLHQFLETLFIVYPRTDGSWGVKAVRENVTSFKNKKSLPSSWAGLRDEELQKVTGVSDAIFCHRALFLAGAKSKEGAIKLAELALLEPHN